MSVDYAAGLSDYDDLGVCGLDEVFDTIDDLKKKVKILSQFLLEAKGSCVVHVGAGLSTSAGIRDFRGKTGVWTELLSKKKFKIDTINCDDAIKISNQSYESDSQKGKCDINVKIEEPSTSIALNETKTKDFDETKPTIGHLVLKKLCELGYIKHIISQNVDGLFLKSSLNRKFISELHGNFYLDECKNCRSRYIRSTASKTMRLKTSNVKCLKTLKRPKTDDDKKESKKTCSGYLRDTILDWDSSIPYNELKTAKNMAKKCKLHICIGTSLQLRPSRDLVCKKGAKTNNNCKLVIINLQPTQFDKNADLIINYYSDEVMKELASEMNFDIPQYNQLTDPTKNSDLIGTIWNKR